MEDKLIVAVQNHPIIYNKNLKGYSSANARENAWKEIATEMGSNNDVEVLKKRWRTLRDAFIKHNKSEKLVSGVSKKKKWIFYDQLLFLLPFMKHNETVDSYDRNDVQNVEEDPNVYEFQSINIKTETDRQTCQQVAVNTAETNVSIQDTKSSMLTIDPDEQFMLSCVPILKRLSKKNNMLARIEIQNILFRLEFGSNPESSPSTASTNQEKVEALSPIDIDEVSLDYDINY